MKKTYEELKAENAALIAELYPRLSREEAEVFDRRLAAFVESKVRAAASDQR